MRIGIDCRLAGRQHAGIGRYVSELVRHLVQTETNHTWVLTVYSQAQARELLSQPPDTVEWAVVPVKHYTVKEQLLMPFVFKRQKLDLLHIPHFNLPIFYPGKSVITVHDLLWHGQRGNNVTTLPMWQYWLKYGFYRLVVRIAVNRAKLIITPSQVVKRQVAKFYPRVTDKIRVIPEGVYVDLSQAAAPQIHLPKRYLLYVGSLYPHKNLSFVLRVMSKINQSNLVIVSARSVFTSRIEQEIKQFRLQDRVFILSNIDDAQLTWLYLHATALIQPSLSEGFGLTGLEAMACGTPVLASKIPIFDEVYGQAAKFFNPNQPNSLLQLIKKLKAPTQTESTQLKQHANKYGWQKMTDSILQIYESCQNQN